MSTLPIVFYLVHKTHELFRVGRDDSRSDDDTWLTDTIRHANVAVFYYRTDRVRTAPDEVAVYKFEKSTVEGGTHDVEVVARKGAPCRRGAVTTATGVPSPPVDQWRGVSRGIASPTPQCVGPKHRVQRYRNRISN